MSSIDLLKIDAQLVKQIVKKFNAYAGAKFYCSCRRAKNFVEWLKPTWIVPNSLLYYEEYEKKSYAGACLSVVERSGRPGPAIKIPLELFRIENVWISARDPHYFRTVVVPELAAMGSVNRVQLSARFSKEEVQLLLAAVNQETIIELFFCNYPATCDSIKTIQNLAVNADPGRSSWTEGNLIELGMNRKTLTLKFYVKYYRKMMKCFVEYWLNGGATGSLKQITLIHKHATKLKDRYALRKSIRVLAHNHLKTKNGYILERAGSDRLCICIEYKRITFAFNTF